MRNPATRWLGSALVATIVMLTGWSVLADEEGDRPAPPPTEEERDEGESSLGGPRPESRMRDRDREDEGSWRSRRGPGSFDDRRGDRRGWRDSDRDRWSRRGPDDDLPPMTEEEVESLMGRVQERIPELHDKMVRLRREHPEDFKRMAERVRRLVADMDHGRRGDPFTFFREMRRLADAYRKNESEQEKGQIKTQMRSRLAEHIERRQEELREEIRHMETRLAEMKARLSEFEANQDEHVDRCLEKILSGEDFGPPPGRGPRDREHMVPGRDPGRDFERGGPRSRPADGWRGGGDRPERDE